MTLVLVLILILIFILILMILVLVLVLVLTLMIRVVILVLVLVLILVLVFLGKHHIWTWRKPKHILDVCLGNILRALYVLAHYGNIHFGKHDLVAVFIVQGAINQVRIIYHREKVIERRKLAPRMLGVEERFLVIGHLCKNQGFGRRKRQRRLLGRRLVHSVIKYPAVAHLGPWKLVALSHNRLFALSGVQGFVVAQVRDASLDASQTRPDVIADHVGASAIHTGDFHLLSPSSGGRGGAYVGVSRVLWGSG